MKNSYDVLYLAISESHSSLWCVRAPNPQSVTSPPAPLNDGVWMQEDLFFSAAKPSGPRTLGVVLLVVGGEQLSEYNIAVCFRLYKFTSGWDPSSLDEVIICFLK